jgi:hypothetical protein
MTHRNEDRGAAATRRGDGMATRCRHETRETIYRVAALVMIAFASVFLVGCGEDAGENIPSASSLPAPATAPATTEPVAAAAGAPTVSTLSQHERVMAEQGRLYGPRAARSTTTTSTDPLESGVSASSASAAPQDAAPLNDTTTVILSGGQTPLQGVWGGTAEQLASYLLAAAPSSPLFTVSPEVLAGYYIHYCAEAGLRADLLWAQMIHETGYGLYGGDVSPEQNNYAGVGATGNHEPGISFATAEAGVVAHIAHMVAYVYTDSPVAWANASTDPRFDFVNPRGTAWVLANLDGRWAVPGIGYGERIEAIARAINSY